MQFTKPQIKLEIIRKILKRNRYNDSFQTKVNKGIKNSGRKDSKGKNYMTASEWNNVVKQNKKYE